MPAEKGTKGNGSEAPPKAAPFGSHPSELERARNARVGASEAMVRE